MIPEVSKKTRKREWRMTKKAEAQVLRIFNGVGGFGRTCLNKNARGNNIKGEFFDE